MKYMNVRDVASAAFWMSTAMAFTPKSNVPTPCGYTCDWDWGSAGNIAAMAVVGATVVCAAACCVKTSCCGFFEKRNSQEQTAPNDVAGMEAGYTAVQ